MSGCRPPVPAAPAARAAAALVDAFVLVLAWAALALAAARAGSPLAGPGVPVTVAMHELASALAVPMLGAGLLFWALAWRLFSGTPGQLLLGCQVVCAGRARGPGLGRSLWRAGCLVVTVAPLGAGLLWAFFDARRRALHDRLAGTEVVVEDESRSDLRRLLEQVG